MATAWNSAYGYAFYLVLVAVLVVASIPSHAVGQEASVQAETRKIAVIVGTGGDRWFDALDTTFAVALDDFNKWLAAENKGWRLDVETIQVQDDNGLGAVLEGLADQNITAVAGYISDAGLEAAKDTIHEKNLVVISSRSGMPALANPDDNIFRTALNYEHRASAMVEIMKSDGVDDVLLISLDSARSKASADLLEARVVEEDGMRMLGVVYSSAADLDAATKIRGAVEDLLAESQSDAKVAIIMHIGSQSMLDAVRDLKDLDAISNPVGKVTFHGRASSIPVIKQNPDVFDFLNRVGYHVFTAGVHSNDINRGIDSALAAKDLPVFGATSYDAYDALYILGRAIDRAGGVADADKIREQMHMAAEEHVSARGLPTESLPGFDENGDRASQDYHMTALIHGEFVLSKEYDPHAHPSNLVVDLLAKPSDPSPVRQVAGGVFPGDVACKDGLVLMLRGDGSPLCVTPASAETLAVRGIAAVVEGGADLVVSTTRLSDTFAERDDEIRSVVNAAVEIYEAHGDEALGMITAGADAYEGGPYPFAVDIYTKKVVAHGAIKERIGATSAITESDIPYDQLVGELESTGELWTFYTFVNPETGANQTKKSLLILRDAYAFGSGYYPTSLEIDMMASMGVANSAAVLYEEYGADALDMITEAAASYEAGSLYPFVIEIDTETVAAHGVSPSLVGSMVADVTVMSKSIAQIQKESELNGGTWSTTTILNPATGDDELKMSWTTIRDNYIFGSGFYPDEYVAKQIGAMMAADMALAMYSAYGEAAFAAITALNIDDGPYPFVLKANTSEEVADGSVNDHRGQIGWRPYELRAGIGGIMEALEGGRGAWTTYIFMNPDTGKEAKRAWIVLHDDYLFAAGFHLHGLDAKMADVEWAIATAIELYNEVGEEAFAAISEMGYTSESYPFVLAPDLTVVVNPANPDSVGKAMEDLVVPDKGRGQILAELERDGTSWIEYEFVSPETDRVEVKRVLLKAHDGYVFGSGYLLNQM